MKMGKKKQTSIKQAQGIFAASRLKMTPLELELMTAMGFLRSLALFKEESPEVDTLKCTSHED